MLLYNSLTQKKENFLPLKKTSVSIYVCGITPYDTTHLGHAFTYIFFDVLLRYLLFKGYQVTYTQNVTDINDRDNDILKRAQEQNVPWQNLAKFWTGKFLTDMNTLGWKKPTHYLWASTEINSMTAIIQKIIDNGFGYVVNGSVYLDTSKISSFGKLSRFSKEEMFKKAKEFEEDLNNPDKKNPLDVTLWKATAENQPIHIPTFESQWGKGRPGWHIECSAMSISSLGEQIDIHGGGIDLIYPHHESEIAQSESATLKKPFARFWVHTGTVMYNGGKMSKSLGNLVLISDLLKKYSPNAIRWMLLSNPWNESWEFFEKKIQDAQSETQKIESLIKDVKQEKTDLTEFEDIMDDNLNTPKALKYLESETNTKKLKAALDILGFT